MKITVQSVIFRWTSDDFERGTNTKGKLLLLRRESQLSHVVTFLPSPNLPHLHRPPLSPAFSVTHGLLTLVTSAGKDIAVALASALAVGTVSVRLAANKNLLNFSNNCTLLGLSRITRQPCLLLFQSSQCGGMYVFFFLVYSFGLVRRVMAWRDVMFVMCCDAVAVISIF